jgi:hypothetical protein
VLGRQDGGGQQERLAGTRHADPAGEAGEGEADVVERRAVEPVVQMDVQQRRRKQWKQGGAGSTHRPIVAHGRAAPAVRSACAGRAARTVQTA